jgi:hypothetical protein
MAKDDIYCASPIPQSPKRPRRKVEVSRPQTRSIRASKLRVLEDAEVVIDEATEKEPPVLTTFPVQKLPQELRMMIWKEVLLHDDVNDVVNDPQLRGFGPDGPDRAVRRHVPGYYRPTALVTRSAELFRGQHLRYQQVLILNRVPSLFLVDKTTFIEAREIAFRHVAIEIDRDICKSVLRKWTLRLSNPMLRNMRNLYICAPARVPRPQSSAAPMAMGGSYPVLDFNCRQVPLFHVSVSRKGGALTLYAQRDLAAIEKLKLDRAIARWRTTLDSNHRFSSKDLICIAQAILRVQDEILWNTWTLRIDDQDRLTHKMEADAQKAEERKTGYRDFSRGWMYLEPDFRVTVAKIVAPCVQVESNE